MRDIGTLAEGRATELPRLKIYQHDVWGAHAEVSREDDRRPVGRGARNEVYGQLRGGAEKRRVGLEHGARDALDRPARVEAESLRAGGPAHGAREAGVELARLHRVTRHPGRAPAALPSPHQLDPPGAHGGHSWVFPELPEARTRRDVLRQPDQEKASVTLSDDLSCQWEVEAAAGRGGGAARTASVRAKEASAPSATGHTSPHTGPPDATQRATSSGVTSSGNRHSSRNSPPTVRFPEPVDMAAARCTCSATPLARSIARSPRASTSCSKRRMRT